MLNTFHIPLGPSKAVDYPKRNLFTKEKKYFEMCKQFVI